MTNHILRYTFTSFLLALCVFLTDLANAEAHTFPQIYTSSNRQIYPLTLIPSLSSQSSFLSQACKNSNGSWENTANALICSMSLNGVINSLASTNGAVTVLSLGGTQSSYWIPGQNSDPWIPPHALWLGAQRSGAAAAISGISTDDLGTGSSLVIRGMMDGPMDLGCLLCTAQTPYSAMSSRAPLSGNLSDPTQIASLPSFDSAMVSNVGGTVQPGLVFENVTYDAKHIYLPGCGPGDTGTCLPLTTAQAARLHPNMYVTTNSIDPKIPQHGYLTGNSLDPLNVYVALTTGDVSSDGKSISVYGWGVFNGNEGWKLLNDRSYKHPWSATDFPSKIYDTVRNNYGHSEVAIGAPTGMEIENSFVTLDPDNNPASLIRYTTLKEWNYHYAASKDNAGTMQGIVLAYDCSGSAKSAIGTCRHPTTDSTALTINGTNLPNGIQVTLPSWGNEYKGYNFYIPASNAPGTGVKWDFVPTATLGSIHTGFESFTPTYDVSNQIVLRNWTEQSNSTKSPVWEDYSVNIGLVIDGERWDPSGSTGTHMGTLSFNWNSTNLGGVCLVNNQNMNIRGLARVDPGLCIRGDGTMHAGYAATFDKDVTIDSQLTLGSYLNMNGNLWVEDGNAIFVSPKGTKQSDSAYFAANSSSTVFLTTSGNKDNATFQSSFITNDTQRVKDIRSLSTIIVENHKEGDHVWCHDCRNSNQNLGLGTGRWIFLDNVGTWRSDDGVIAVN